MFVWHSWGGCKCEPGMPVCPCGQSSKNDLDATSNMLCAAGKAGYLNNKYLKERKTIQIVKEIRKEKLTLIGNKQWNWWHTSKTFFDKDAFEKKGKYHSRKDSHSFFKDLMKRTPIKLVYNPLWVRFLMRRQRKLIHDGMGSKALMHSKGSLSH